MTPKAQAMKEKVDKLRYSKLKIFSTSKDTIDRIKGQSMKWGKIFTNHISDKRLIFRTYKELIQFNNNNKTTQFKNGQKT